MTKNELALVDRVELILGRSMAIALPGGLANQQLAKWEDELGPKLLAIVRRLDAEDERLVQRAADACERPCGCGSDDWPCHADSEKAVAIVLELARRTIAGGT